MPFMRLTWDGIALHAGRVPGEPASHGCIRLPLEFSKILFDATESGMIVVITDELSPGADMVWPGERAPVDHLTGLALNGRGEEPTVNAMHGAAASTASTYVEAFAEQ